MDPSSESLLPLHERITIAELKQVANGVGQPYAVHAQVDVLTEKQTQQGKPYFEIVLTDGTGSLLWRVFDSSPLFDAVRHLPRSGAWIELIGQWVDTGKYGLEPKQAELRRLTSEEVHVLLQGSEEVRLSHAADYGEIISRIAAVRDPRLKLLGEVFLEKYEERFRRTAAAREFHHARRGGLLEHVAQMMRSAAALCVVYPHLNQDLLIIGVLFHDCGKLWENAYAENSFSMPYHLHGEMLGHIPLGLELVNKLWRELMERPVASDWLHFEPASEHVRLHLLHLVASHHGELQFGSPILPKTPEAIALHYIDNLDAKLEMFRRGYRNGQELAPGIFERVRPLPQNLVEPLKPMPPLVAVDSLEAMTEEAHD